MTRSEDRQDRSRQRSREYVRKRRTNAIVLGVATFLYVGVPVLWNGAVEFGYVQPIKSQSFKSSLVIASFIIIYIMIRTFINYERYGKQDRAIEKEEDKPVPQA